MNVPRAVILQKKSSANLRPYGVKFVALKFLLTQKVKML